MHAHMDMDVSLWHDLFHVFFILSNIFYFKHCIFQKYKVPIS